MNLIQNLQGKYMERIQYEKDIAQNLIFLNLKKVRKLTHLTKSMKIARRFKTRSIFVIYPGHEEFELSEHMTALGLYALNSRHLTASILH